MSEKKQDWFSIEITAAPAAAEAIEFALNSLDAQGTAINHVRKGPLEDVVVIGYFETLPDEDRVQDELHYGLRSYGHDDEAVTQIIRRSVENADWLAEWKKHWKPTVVGSFVIAPPWETVDDTEKIVIRIEPNMAFGTGTHETTKLCVAEIERVIGDGDSVLDVGTGTGILAIAAAKLELATENTERLKRVYHLDKEPNSDNSVDSVAKNSVVTILACDTDSDSVKIARENASLNGLAHSIEFYEGSIRPEIGKFDVVLANLTIDVILPILPMMIAATGRFLIMSGILATQRPQIEEALNEMGSADFQVNELGEWISVTVEVFNSQV